MIAAGKGAIVNTGQTLRQRDLLQTDTAGKGAVANAGREMAKEYLRKHQSFVWNATNLTPQMREQLISLFESYNANVHIMYDESAYDKLSKQNKDREDVVPQEVIDKMIGKLVLPLAFEARNVTWMCSNNNKN